MQKPIYQQIVNSIIKRIEDGEYSTNEKIGSERDLAELYGVNRLTVKRAITSLEEMGYVYQIPNKGTYVKGDNNKLLLGIASSSQNTGISARLKEVGLQITNEVVFSDIIEGYYSMNSRLRLQKDDKIFALYRIRKVDGEPLGIEYTYVPEKYFPDIVEQDFEKKSLYDYMNIKEHLPSEFTQKIMIIHCPKRESKILKLNKNEDAVFCFEYLGRDKRGKVVEFTRCYLRSDKIKFRFYQYRSENNY